MEEENQSESEEEEETGSEDEEILKSAKALEMSEEEPKPEYTTSLCPNRDSALVEGV
jgi:hypothetical protein